MHTMDSVKTSSIAHNKLSCDESDGLLLSRYKHPEDDPPLTLMICDSHRYWQ